MVVGLILSAVITVGCSVILPQLKLTAITKEGFSQFNWISLIIVAVFFPLSKIKIKNRKIHPIILIVLSAAVGIVLFGALKITQ